jgi:glycosyl hydrolase family 26
MAPQEWDKSTGRIPFINWNAAKNDGSVARWSAIANGSQDSWIQQRADAFRAFASPVYLSFHHEPEDDTSRFGTPAEFAAAFRHIVTVFRQRNVTNVAFVWTMMAWSFDGRSGRNPMDYYPGDSYVDLVGSDGYNWYGVRAGESWRSFAQVFATSRAFALAHRKPWIAVEYGVTEDRAVPGRKAQWFRDILPTVQGWPDLKGLIYFDSTRSGNNWVSDSSSTSISAFGALARAPALNGGGGTSAPVSTPTPSPSPSPTPSPGTGGGWENSLNVGPDEGSITAGGSSSGGDAFSSVQIDGGASLRYDNAHAIGAFGARHTVPSRGNAYYEWGGNFTSWYGRIDVWLGANPTGALRLMRAASGGSLRCAIDLLPSGQLRVVDSANRTIASSSATFATGRWIRIEWSVSHPQGRVTVRLFNDANATSPTATLVSSGGSIGGSTGQVQLGRSGSQSFSVTFWTDEPAVSTTGFPGPA